MRVLMGWELGANLGHAQLLSKVGAHLEGCGAKVFIASQQVDALPKNMDSKIAFLQAPVWPNLLKDVRTPRWETDPADYGEIFTRLCLDRENALGAMLGAWETLLDLVDPDLVISDTAPALHFSANHRCHAVRIGSGYDVLPFDLENFPRLRNIPHSGEAKAGLANVNRTLESLGRPLIRTLPEFFRSERDFVCTIPELDPYADCRSAIYCPPVPLQVSAKRAHRNEIFVYMHAMHSEYIPLWRALANVGLPIRVFVPNLTSSHRSLFDQLGFETHNDPVPLNDILDRSLLIITSGGIGLTTAAVVHGIPQIVIYHDLEKQMTGKAIGSIGCGTSHNIADLKEENITSSISHCLGQDVQDSCLNRSEDVSSRGYKEIGDELTSIVAHLGNQ